jgi:acyl-CoA synthetase (AMP-forming)/AMP-acid ligase II
MSIYDEKIWLKNYDKNVPPNLSYEDITLTEKFQEAVEQFPDKPALYFMGNQITFRELDEAANQLASYLLKSGLKPDDVIGLNMPNIPAHYIGVIAVQKAGCISTGISLLLSAHELEYQINDSQAKAIITVDAFFDKIAEIADRTNFKTLIVSGFSDFTPASLEAGEFKQLASKKVASIREIMQTMPKDPVAVPRGMDDQIFLMYTGGTTGPSKGAMLSQRNYMCNRLQLFAWLDVTPEDTLMSAFPLFHIAGLTVAACSLTTGISQVCIPDPRDSNFMLQAIQNYKTAGTLNVPTVYFELMKKPEFRAIDFSPLKWCHSAAAPFPPDLIPELEAVIGEGKFIELYGMTEMSPVTCCNPRYGKKKPTSVGIPIPDTEVKILVPETGEPAEIGEPGEMVVRGPQLMRGYYKKPEETAHAIRDGWMYTGDIAKIDEDGYFYIIDRLKDVVIVSGYKVFTRELDDVLMNHPDVKLAASFGIPDPNRPGSERVAAVISLKPGIEKNGAEKDEILKYLKANVAPYEVPKVIEFMDHFPTSGVGKILKRELKQKVAAIVLEK